MKTPALHCHELVQSLERSTEVTEAIHSLIVYAAIWLLILVLFAAVLNGDLIAAYIQRIFQTSRVFRLHMHTSAPTRTITSPEPISQQAAPPRDQETRTNRAMGARTALAHPRSLPLAAHLPVTRAAPLKAQYAPSEQGQSHIEATIIPLPLIVRNAQRGSSMTHIRSPLGIHAPSGSNRA